MNPPVHHPAPRPPMRGPLAALAAALYGGVVRHRNQRFDRGKGVITFDRPVISVGNLSVGGTGKTPMVAYLVRLLREHGSFPCIAMRGYGRPAGEGQDSDEAAIYRRQFPDIPIVAQPNRAAGLIELFGSDRGARVDSIILDDGFQHRRIARQADIVLIDATRTPFTDKLLPAGWLREPVASLRRAHAAVITHAEAVTRTDAIDLETQLWPFLPRAVVAVCRHSWTGLLVGQDAVATDWLRGKRLYAACAIGNPGPFLAAARDAAGGLVGATILRDHAQFAPEEVRSLVANLRDHQADALLVTEKDWSKLAHLPPGTWPCPVARPVLNLTFDRQEQELQQLVLSAVRLFKDEG